MQLPHGLEGRQPLVALADSRRTGRRQPYPVCPHASRTVFSCMLSPKANVLPGLCHHPPPLSSLSLRKKNEKKTPIKTEQNKK
jgi:hypothetical protein